MTSFWNWLIAPYRPHRGFLFTSLALYAVSLAIRVWLVAHVEWHDAADSHDYHELARNLAEGRGYYQVYLGEIEAYHGLTLYAYRMPGYSAILAALYTVFGWNPVVAMAFNILCELVTEFCLVAMAFHLFGRRAALFAQAFWAFHVFWVVILQTETVFTTCFTVAAALLIYAGPRSSYAWAAGLGLVAAFAIFLRPIGIAIFPAIGLKMLMESGSLRRRAAILLVILLPTVAGLGVWAHRNYRILGQPIVLTSQAGRLNARFYGINFEHVYRRGVEKGWNEAEINSHLKQAVSRRMRADPTRVAQVTWTRLTQLLSLTGARDHRSMHLGTNFGQEQLPRWLLYAAIALYAVQYYPIYAMAALAPFALWRRRIRVTELALVTVSFVIVHSLVSKGNVRYAAPLYPLFLLLASYTFSFVVRCGRPKTIETRFM